jgi:hypothetical protein
MQESFKNQFNGSNHLPRQLNHGIIKTIHIPDRTWISGRVFSIYNKRKPILRRQQAFKEIFTGR